MMTKYHVEYEEGFEIELQDDNDLKDWIEEMLYNDESFETELTLDEIVTGLKEEINTNGFTNFNCYTVSLSPQEIVRQFEEQSPLEHFKMVELGTKQFIAYDGDDGHALWTVEEALYNLENMNGGLAMETTLNYTCTRQ